MLYTNDNKNFTIMDGDRSGRRQFQLPNDGYIKQLNKSVSPDGKWLAFFTGSIEEPYDISLNFLNLADRTTQPISNLLAQGFPENLEPIVSTMILGDPPIYYVDCFEDMECRRSLVEQELINSLFTFIWSPDSQSIAFTAQIDGPSSDIYIYNTQNNLTHQLTNEPQNIYWLDWAPNGKGIIYEICSTPGTGYEGRTLHVTDLKGKTTFIDEADLYNKRWAESGWLTDNLYLIDHPNDTDKPPIYDLIVVNTDIGQLMEIWPYSLESYAINKENATIAIIHRNHSNQVSTVQEGVYIVYPSGKYEKISDIGIFFILMEGQNPYPVLVQDYNGQFFNISSGSIDELPWDSDSSPIISPDGKLFLFRNERNGLALYKDSHQTIKSWSMDETIYGITWRPDSLGFFFSTEKNIYYLDLSNEKTQPLGVDCSPAKCTNTRFIWLP